MTVFIAAPGTETLPVRMFLYIQDNIDPLVTSVSACVIAVTVLALMVLDRAYGLERLLVGQERPMAASDYDVAVVGGGLVGVGHRLGPGARGLQGRRARRGRPRRARVPRQLRAGLGAEQGLGLPPMPAGRSARRTPGRASPRP